MEIIKNGINGGSRADPGGLRHLFGEFPSICKKQCEINKQLEGSKNTRIGPRGEDLTMGGGDCPSAGSWCSLKIGKYLTLPLFVYLVARRISQSLRGAP